MNDQLFDNIDTISKAMEEGKKIGAVYNYMEPDFELHPVFGDPDYHQLLNPYAMVMRNGFYFLICNKDNYDDLTHYRIDRMTDVRIEDKPVKPVRNLKDFRGGLDIREYMEHNINMAFGNPEHITFTAHPHAVPALIDAFGKGITFENSKDGNYNCTVNVPEYDMERFAMENWDLITVTGPLSLLEKLKWHSRTLAKKYAGS